MRDDDRQTMRRTPTVRPIPSQMSLFGAPDTTELPAGMSYAEELIDAVEERSLVEFIATLPLKPFEFSGGFRGHRLVTSFGSHYDYAAQRVAKSPDIPVALFPLRDKVAAFSGLSASTLQQVLITQYPPGAGIGWHRDRPHYDDVIGVSLLAPCNFRLRLTTGQRWRRVSLTLVPRSAYLLSGKARSEWEHSISPLDALRYSITFRSLRTTPASTQ
jgi:alkylated DNA repair dioxygenase AlkB